jgi:hypothetical protein
MIGRQVRLYLHPDDQTEFVELVQGEMQAVLLTPRSVSPEPSIVDSWQAAGYFARICQSTMLGSLVPEHFSTRDEWYFDTSENPLVEWSMSVL